MKQKIIFLIIIVTIFSCSPINEEDKNVTSQKNENPKLEIIQIQFVPSFISPSMLTYDLNKDKILFQRIGMRSKLKVLPPEGSGDIIEVFSPKTSYYLIDTLNSTILKDTILNNFTNFDFKDMSMECHDGIWTSTIITYDNGSINDFELNNNGTKNQYRLILKLLDICISNETDSLNTNYLLNLKGYYQ